MQPEKHIFCYLISFQVEEEKENKSLIQTGAPPNSSCCVKTLPVLLAL